MLAYTSFPAPIVWLTGASLVGAGICIRSLIWSSLISKQTLSPDARWLNRSRMYNEVLRLMAHIGFIVIGILTMFVDPAYLVAHPVERQLTGDLIDAMLFIIPTALVASSLWSDWFWKRAGFVKKTAGGAHTVRTPGAGPG
jgi:hypothetical protein